MHRFPIIREDRQTSPPKMRRAKPFHDLHHINRSDRMPVLVRLPSPFWIANVNVDVDRSVPGTGESNFCSSDLLGREWKGDDDECPKETGVEDDGPPSRRYVR